jgi:hypothetical protein
MQRPDSVGVTPRQRAVLTIPDAAVAGRNLWLEFLPPLFQNAPKPGGYRCPMTM